jgi:hypothetical protein
MSMTMRRAVVPLLAAPVALIALAGNATAVVTPYPDGDKTDGPHVTHATCYHPYAPLAFEVYITTGEEGAPQGLDVSSVDVQGVDDQAEGDFHNGAVQAKHLRWQYGIVTGYGKDTEFKGSSGVFSAGASIRNGGDNHSGLPVTDVQAIWFEYVWKTLDPTAIRTLSCVVKLDGYYAKY